MTDITERVFEYFYKICSIPHGSGNMGAISDFCINFAKEHSLKAIKDEAENVIIYKSGTVGFENAKPVILQGHLDMVCQKEEGCSVDFNCDGISPYIDGDFIKARCTTLGADNGIAVAMILAILESDSIAHPPIEAVFTTDEETGMYGAIALSPDLLSGKRMINLDSEEMDTLTVSCAGGSRFEMKLPFEKKTAKGKRVDISLCGLLGGHSGIEIDKGRQNANILMGKILNRLKSVSNFDILEINGGDKENVIPNSCKAKLLVKDEDAFTKEAEKTFETVKNEISDIEEDFTASVLSDGEGEFTVMDEETLQRLLFLLTCVPNGVMARSSQIENLVETSLNLGVLKTENAKIVLNFALRSSKAASLTFLEEKLSAFAEFSGCSAEISGHYPPWEYREKSPLREIYKETFCKQFSFVPKIEAIHAGLECGIFASKIKDLDCIAFGPDIFDAHTTEERLSISSAKKTFAFLVKFLEKLK